MKFTYFIFGVVLFFSIYGCGLRERENAIEKRENEVNQKEQQLLLQEKQLQLKEEELAQREKYIDSTQNEVVADSFAINPKIIGNWAVSMRCTATTCEGSAVGDTKNEQWEIAFQDQNVIVKAKADNKLVRVYSGVFKENSLQLTAQHEPEAPNTKIMVKLTFKNDSELEGTREIHRDELCQIVYAMTLKKA